MLLRSGYLLRLWEPARSWAIRRGWIVYSPDGTALGGGEAPKLGS